MLRPAAPVAFALLLAACTETVGDDDGASSTVGDAAGDVTTDAGETSTGDGDGDTGDGDTGDGDTGDGDGIADAFDETPGDNTYAGGLGVDNWVDAGVLAPNAGTQSFASSNGNSFAFPGLELHKDLGGTVADVTYEVSIWVTKSDGNDGITFADFTELRVGGPAGVVNWSATPEPTVTGQWVQWIGTYTPDASDVGGPFGFSAIFDLPGAHSVGFDGPITAVPAG